VRRRHDAQRTACGLSGAGMAGSVVLGQPVRGEASRWKPREARSGGTVHSAGCELGSHPDAPDARGRLEHASSLNSVGREGYVWPEGRRGEVHVLLNDNMPRLVARGRLQLLAGAHSRHERRSLRSTEKRQEKRRDCKPVALSPCRRHCWASLGSRGTQQARLTVSEPTTTEHADSRPGINGPMAYYYS
jgi:hypothetical protein